jgi:sRNA-binding regulator protein Hfq
MLDARAGICQEAVKTLPLRAEETSTQQQSQAAQQNQGTPATSSAAQTQPARLDDKARKIKRTVEKIGVGGKLTLYLKNGEDLYGSVVRYDEEGVQITEIDLKQVVTVQYKNIKKVREDYGNPNIFTGKRNNPPKGIRIGVLAAALAFAFLPIIVVLTAKD